MKKNEENKGERVLCYVRIRPFSKDEMERDKTSPIEAIDPNNNSMTVKKEFEKKNFNYDKIFPENSNQSEIFQIAGKSVIDSVLEGYNGTIFAYGQTGSGKTYTMVGEFDNEENKGIIPRSFDYIFQKISDLKNNDENSIFTISIAFIQIYIENIQDLFEPKNKVVIREDKENGVFLDGCQWIKVSNLKETAENFHRGEKIRVTESTKMNAHSSRSHALLVVKIEKSFQKNNTNYIMTRSYLYLVDLAGSERVNKTNAKEMRLEEAKKINYSLLILGNCIQSLTDPKSGHVNYRDSKLTRLLQESLGGNAKTSLIVTISPSSYNAEETISSLNFGQRAMKVKNKPVINATKDFFVVNEKLQIDYDLVCEKYKKLLDEFNLIKDENLKFKNGEIQLDFKKENIKKNFENFNKNNFVDVNNNHKEKIEELNKKNKELENLIEKINKEKENKNDEINELKLKNKNFENQTKNNKNLIKKFEEEKQSFLNEKNEQIIKINELNNNLFLKETESKQTAKIIENKNNEINQLKNLLNEYEKKINDYQIKEKKKENETKKIGIQTENMLDSTIKENLIDLNIDSKDIVYNNYSEIIKNLINNFQIKLDNEILKYKNQIKKLNEQIEKSQKISNESEKNYQNEIQNLKLLNKNLNTEIENLKNSEEESEKMFLIKEIDRLKKFIEDKKKDYKITEELKRKYENSKIDVNTEKKIIELKYKHQDNNYKNLQNNYSNCENGLNRTFNFFELYNQKLIQLKNKISQLFINFECDLQNIKNLKTYEYTINKINDQFSLIENLIKNTNNFESIEENTENKESKKNKNIKLINLENNFNQIIKDNKNLLIYFLESIIKTSKMYFEIFKTNSKFKIKNDISEDEEIQKLQKNLNVINENYLNCNLLLFLKKKIKQNSDFCLCKNDDLINKINSISNNLSNKNFIEILKDCFKIFQEFLNRLIDFEKNKILQNDNLNEKILFFLKQIEILKSKQKHFLKKNLEKSDFENIYKNELNETIENNNNEIDRLKKLNENYTEKIKELSADNEILKTQILLLKEKTGTENENEEINEINLEENIKDYQQNIKEINKKLENLKSLKYSSNLNKETDYKTNYLINRLKKNLKNEN